MGSSKNFDALASIFLNNGGNRGDEAGGRERFLQIEMALVIRVFSSNSFFQDGINCSLLQGLVLIDHVHRFYFISKEAFLAVARSATKSYTQVMPSGRRSGTDCLSPVRPAEQQLTARRKPPYNISAAYTKEYFLFNHKTLHTNLPPGIRTVHFVL
jgi:hypothetical protein